MGGYLQEDEDDEYWYHECEDNDLDVDYPMR